MLAGRGMELLLCSTGNFGFDSLFQVTVETLVGIQFRCVTRQVKDLDPLAAFGQPLFDRSAVMHAQVIEHQKDFASHLFEQSLEEVDETLVVEVAVDNLSADLALIGRRRDHR